MTCFNFLARIKTPTKVQSFILLNFIFQPNDMCKICTFPFFFCIPNFHTLTMCWYRKIITLSSECAHVLVLVCFRYIPAWYCCVESSFLYQTEARRHQFGRFVCFSLAFLVLRRICWYPAHFDSHLKSTKKKQMCSLISYCKKANMKCKWITWNGIKL